MENSTVTFDVGGKIFKVNRSLLSKFDEKMVLRVAAELSDIPNEPIFIDRDGERFVYVLDYMRDGKANLPFSISKGSFISDLDYYGIDAIHGNIFLISSCASQMDLCHANHQEQVREIEDQIRKLEVQIQTWTIKKECRLLAKCCLDDVLSARVNKNDKKMYSFTMSKFIKDNWSRYEQIIKDLREIFPEYGFVDIDSSKSAYAFTMKTY